MKQSSLIIRDELVEPPTDSMAFRTITMVVHENLAMNVLLHTSQDMKDLYYHFMKPKGLMDYIDYILAGREFESGIWLSTSGMGKVQSPIAIVVRAIRYENQFELLGRIRALSGIK